MMFDKKNTQNLKNEIDFNNIPNHIAIIMDGNGRWAKKRNLPRKIGHKEGAKTLENIITCAKKIGVKHLTVYAFSTENWKRSEDEINALMDILRHYLKYYFEKFDKDDIGMDIIGDPTRLDIDIQKQIQDIEEKSKNKTAMTVHIALNYGGRDELCRSIKKIATKVENGELSPEDIDENLISSMLDTKNIPDPELLIRTSFEERISNFLLWQIAYSELYFAEELWPDFNEESLFKAIAHYQNRERRFGGR